LVFAKISNLSLFEINILWDKVFSIHYLFYESFSSLNPKLFFIQILIEEGFSTE